MKTYMFRLSIIVFVGVSLLMIPALPVHGEGPPTLLRNAGFHRTQAVTYRQEATQLSKAIDRYELLARIYTYGSERSSGTMNPQGRRLMVVRTKRVIRYFTQEKQEKERLAADHDALAQSLPEN
jgi:hypothetical protein